MTDQTRIGHLQHLQGLPDSVNVFNESGAPIGFAKSLRIGLNLSLNHISYFPNNNVKGHLISLLSLGFLYYDI
jgi:hypothetical protein